MPTTTMTARENPFSAARRDGRRDACGYLCIDNAKDVHDLLRLFLFDGDEPRRFTKVSSYEHGRYRPEVATGLTVEKLDLSLDEDTCGVHVLDTRHSWGLHSRLPTSRDARRDGSDPLRDANYLSFSHDRLEIQLLAPDGGHAWWVVVLEEKR